MKKISILLSIVMLLLTFSSCKNNPDSESSSSNNSTPREEQTLTKTEFDFDVDTMLRFDLPEAGLENVFILDAAIGLLENNVYGRVYLFADDRYGGDMGTSDLYLGIVSDGKMTLKPLKKWENQTSMTGEIQLCDFDGDGDKEILLQETTGMTGGFGQYLSRIFDYRNKEINEIFSSAKDVSTKFDTGFSATVMTECKLKITNSLTGYNETFDYSQAIGGSHPKYWYDENGDPKDLSLLVDSFYEFVPTDIDGDGIFEIKCRQYTSLLGHTDYVGSAVTVLKFNEYSVKFEVASASFEPANV